ncbi:hypothetical protein CLCR_04447 [Cladophialophora carrionii]|uniref:Uncharacterized protein n=1 Tax=Cladophialophora carrionii TaxID=86049 RepID=A0A1C1CHZ7_9EURO|nr:hypothetical protein CLCR_04447 [Cladophialophora carrionii]
MGEIERHKASQSRRRQKGDDQGAYRGADVGEGQRSDLSIEPRNPSKSGGAGSHIQREHSLHPAFNSIRRNFQVIGFEPIPHGFVRLGYYHGRRLLRTGRFDSQSP